LGRAAASIRSALPICSVEFIRAAWALGVQIPFMDFLVIGTTIVVLIILPISIGGLGMREAAYVYLSGRVGVTPEAALGLAILNCLLRPLSVLTGAWVYARRGIRG
jgi:glycosyltransferase 2 family protein